MNCVAALGVLNAASRLEAEFSGQLDLALNALEGGLRSSRSNDSDRTGARSSARVVELRRVEEVEEFRAYLQIIPFREARVLKEGKVDGLCSRALKNIAP